jgi:hypothetical protein
LAKECLCVGLSNSASIQYNQPFLKNLKAVNICPGPNIANFSRIVSLQTMVDHIYGRVNIMTNPARNHMFITELKIYLNYLKEEMLRDPEASSSDKRRAYFELFMNNLEEAIAYYRNLPDTIISRWPNFESELQNADKELETMKLEQENALVV